MVPPSRFRGRSYLHKWPSTRAVAQVRAKIRELTHRRSSQLAAVVADLNRVLRGWGRHFRYSNSSRKFAAIDGHVQRRMAKLASVKQDVRGLRLTTRFDYAWRTSLGIHRLAETVHWWRPV